MILREKEKAERTLFFLPFIADSIIDTPIKMNMNMYFGRASSKMDLLIVTERHRGWVKRGREEYLMYFKRILSSASGFTSDNKNSLCKIMYAR